MEQVFVPQDVAPLFCPQLAKLCRKKWFIAKSRFENCLKFFKSAPSWIPTRKVYCHVDLLAARELPAMDDDGLVDPSYSIQVKDQARS